MTRTPPRGDAFRTDGARLSRALYVAARAVAGRYRAGLAEAGLTYPQYLVMSLLWEWGPMHVRHLGELLALDSGTLSPLVRRLEDAGYVQRRRDEEDERHVRVSTTAEGDALRGPVEALVSSVERSLHTAVSVPRDELIQALRDLA